MSQYITTIGLEVHCELSTNSKLFCSCKNEFGGEPNTHCCPVCSGHPGVLPVLNKRAVEYTVKAGLALGCRINRFSKWDRKNYYYPDLPKAFQTSQFDIPLCVGGEVRYKLNGKDRVVRLNRIHLEEDAGKLVHNGNVTEVDYNRGGVPLMEIVTEPDLISADDAVAFLEELRSVIRYCGVSECKMQEGNMRADVNLSLAKAGQPLGTRTETKNLNSFRSVRRAIESEQARQEEVLSSGGSISQETRHFDDNKGTSYAMRSKEDAMDYRYFPEPDLLPVVLTDKDVEDIKNTVPELRLSRSIRYENEYGLTDKDAEVLTAEPGIAELFDGTTRLGVPAKKVSNYILSEVLRKAKVEGSDDIVVGINAAQLAGILDLVAKNEINLVTSRDVLEKIWLTDMPAAAAVDALGIRQVNDEGEIEKIVLELIAANPGPAKQLREGNEKVMSFFVGQIMRATKGKCNPVIAGELLKKHI